MKYRLTGFSKLLLFLFFISPTCYQLATHASRSNGCNHNVKANNLISQNIKSANVLVDETEFVKMFVETKNGPLNLRINPELTATIITQIPNHARISLIAYDSNVRKIGNQKGKWCEVYYAGYRGWCWGNYLISKEN